jgi:UDP-2,3-diacylglucosamine pyrophosphatase LpxH
VEQTLADTLILSDVHLGSDVSHAREAVRMLQGQLFRRLILLGDIFSDLNFRRLKKEHWQFLGYIRKLSNPKRGVEVVWVEGNHDVGLTDVMSHLVGVKVYQEYMWDYGGKKHLAVHGHQFDRFIVNNLLLSHIGTALHLLLQKLDLKGKPFARFADRANTSWLRLSKKVCAGAVLHARFKGADRVFCGHTHEAMHREKDGIAYYNTGSWTDTKLTFVTVNEEGVQIHEHNREDVRGNSGADDRDSGEERSETDSASADFADEAGLFEDADYAGVGR